MITSGKERNKGPWEGILGEPDLDWWVRCNTSEEVTFKLSVKHNTQILNVHTHPSQNSRKTHRHKQCRAQMPLPPPCFASVPLQDTTLVGSGVPSAGAQMSGVVLSGKAELPGTVQGASPRRWCEKGGQGPEEKGRQRAFYPEVLPVHRQGVVSRCGYHWTHRCVHGGLREEA